MVKIKGIQFCVKNLKMKRKKGQFFFDLPERGFKPLDFLKFAPTILINEGDEIKSREGS